jgi:signal peptidase I
MKDFFNKLSKKLVKLLKILLVVFFIALIIKAFAIDAFQIPSSSMENTLVPGDFIFVNKFAYNISTPHEIPIINFHIPFTNIWKIEKPKIKDIVVYEFPRGVGIDSTGSNVKYVKRIIAGPGDTLQIKNKEVFVNGLKLELPKPVAVSENVLSSILPEAHSIYPPDSKWNKDNYGPIVVPAKGDTIKVTVDNLKRWKSVIVMDFGERALIPEGTVVTLNGKPITEYVLTQDHYFVMGDNMDLSMDSRHFGFITDNMIIGKVMFVYWSYDSEKESYGPLGFLSGIRTNRMFHSVN